VPQGLHVAVLPGCKCNTLGCSIWLHTKPLNEVQLAMKFCIEDNGMAISFYFLLQSAFLAAEVFLRCHKCHCATSPVELSSTSTRCRTAEEELEPITAMRSPELPFHQHSLQPLLLSSKANARMFERVYQCV